MARYKCGIGWTGLVIGVVGESVVEEGGGARGRGRFRAEEEGAGEGEMRRREWSGLVWSGFWLLCFPRAVYILFSGNPLFWSSWRVWDRDTCLSCRLRIAPKGTGRLPSLAHLSPSLCASGQ